MEQPVTGVPMGMQLAQNLQAIESAMPVLEVLHSLHTQAELDPQVKNLPAMKRFSEAGLHQLHSMVAVAGYIRRILCGEQSEPLLAGLQEQIREAQRHTTEVKAAFAEVMRATPARQNEAVQAMSQVMGPADQAARSILAGLQPLTTVQVPARQAP